MRLKEKSRQARQTNIMTVGETERERNANPRKVLHLFEAAVNGNLIMCFYIAESHCTAWVGNICHSVTLWILCQYNSMRCSFLCVLCLSLQNVTLCPGTFQLSFLQEYPHEERHNGWLTKPREGVVKNDWIVKSDPQVCSQQPPSWPTPQASLVFRLVSSTLTNTPLLNHACFKFLIVSCCLV